MTKCSRVGLLLTKLNFAPEFARALQTHNPPSQSGLIPTTLRVHWCTSTTVANGKHVKSRSTIFPHFSIAIPPWAASVSHCALALFALAELTTWVLNEQSRPTAQSSRCSLSGQSIQTSACGSGGMELWLSSEFLELPTTVAGWRSHATLVVVEPHAVALIMYLLLQPSVVPQNSGRCCHFHWLGGLKLLHVAAFCFFGVCPCAAACHSPQGRICTLMVGIR